MTPTHPQAHRYCQEPQGQPAQKHREGHSQRPLTKVDAVATSATCGLFWAWLVHDIEELVTMGPWSRRHLPALARRLMTRLPDGIAARPPAAPAWVTHGLSDTRLRVSISVMGCLMLLLARMGRTTGGRSRLFQVGLLGFGLHGTHHLLSSVVWGGYTPGVVTTPTIVLPFSAYALWELERGGVLRRDTGTIAAAAASLPTTVLAVHIASALLADLGGRALTGKKTAGRG